METHNYDKFHALFVEFGYSEQQIEDIWDMLEKFDDEINP